MLDALLASGIPVAGIVDPGRPAGSTLFDVPVLGGDRWLYPEVKSGDVLLANGIVKPSTVQSILAPGSNAGLVFARYGIRLPGRCINRAVRFIFFAVRDQSFCFTFCCNTVYGTTTTIKHVPDAQLSISLPFHTSLLKTNTQE